MLAHAEDKGVVDYQTMTLWLDDVEVVALGVRGRMAKEEVEGWVRAGVGEWEGEG